MSEHTAVSWIEPELEGMPPRPETSAYAEAHARVIQALSQTETRLADLRKQREEINAEIRLLVDETDLLKRMGRVTKGAKQ